MHWTVQSKLNSSMNLNEVSAKVIGAAIDVHKEIGPGLLESVYQKCMEIELEEKGLKVVTETPANIPSTYW